MTLKRGLRQLNLNFLFSGQFTCNLKWDFTELLIIPETGRCFLPGPIPGFFSNHVVKIKFPETVIFRTFPRIIVKGILLQINGQPTGKG